MSAATDPSTPQLPQQRRRSSATVRQCIEDAARAEFTRNGYLRTPVRNIARTAGVAASVVYRRFGTKQKLYDEVVFGPFVEGLEVLTDEWLHKFDASRENGDQVEEFLGDLYQYFLSRSHVLEQLIDGRSELPADIVDRVRAATNRLCDELYQMLDAMPGREARGSRRQMDLPLRSLIATVLGMSRFSWIVTPRQSQDEVVSSIVTHGLGSVPAAREAYR